MKQRKQLLNSLGLPSPHLSQHLLRLLLLLVTAIGGVGSSWAETFEVTNVASSQTMISVDSKITLTGYDRTGSSTSDTRYVKVSSTKSPTITATGATINSVTFYLNGDFPKQTTFNIAVNENTATPLHTNSASSTQTLNEPIVWNAGNATKLTLSNAAAEGGPNNIEFSKIVINYTPDASDSNPIDMTSSIINPGFEGITVNGSKYGAWDWSKGVNTINGPKYPNNTDISTGCEFWAETATNLKFTLGQTISGLPAGTYKLTASAFNDPNTVDQTSATGRAYLYANNTGTAIVDDAVFGCPSVPVDIKAGTSDYSVIFTMDGTKDLTIGFKTYGVMAARWFACDDFTLTYYGTESTQSETSDATEKKAIDHIRTTGDGCNKEVVLLYNGDHNYLRMTAAKEDNSSFTIAGLSTSDYDVVVTGDDVITTEKVNDNHFYVRVTAKDGVTGTANVKIQFKGNNEYLPIESPEVAITVVEGVTLTYQTGDRGTVSAMTPGGVAKPTGSTIAKGTSLTFTATPNSGYLFDNWHDGSQYISDNPYTTTVNANLNLTANFIESRTINVALATGCESMGTVALYARDTTTPNLSGVEIKKNVNLDFTAIANGNFNFLGWKTTADGSGNYISQDAIYKTKAESIATGSTLYAYFEPEAAKIVTTAAHTWDLTTLTTAAQDNDGIDSGSDYALYWNTKSGVVKDNTENDKLGLTGLKINSTSDTYIIIPGNATGVLKVTFAPRYKNQETGVAVNVKDAEMYDGTSVKEFSFNVANSTAENMTVSIKRATSTAREGVITKIVWTPLQASDLANKTAVTMLAGHDYINTADITKGTHYTTSSTGALTYTSNNTDIVTVDANGLLTAKKAGITTITINQAATFDYAAGSCDVTVNVSDLYASSNAVEVAKDGTIDLDIETSSTGTISVKTSDSSIATASYDSSTKKLTIKGKADGNATITVTEVAVSGQYVKYSITISTSVYTNKVYYQVTSDESTHKLLLNDAIKNAEYLSVSTTETKHWQEKTAKLDGVDTKKNYYQLKSTERVMKVNVQGAKAFEIFTIGGNNNRTYYLNVDGVNVGMINAPSGTTSSGLFECVPEGSTITLTGNNGDVFPAQIKFYTTLPSIIKVNNSSAFSEITEFVDAGDLTYTVSSNNSSAINVTNVVETVATVALTDGTLTIVPIKAGSFTMKLSQNAATVGGKDYAAAEMDIKVTIKKHALKLSYDKSQISIDKNTDPSATLTEAATLSCTIDGVATAISDLSTKGVTVTYDSDDLNVANVDNTGTVSLAANPQGTATITASIENNDNYSVTSATHKIAVIDGYNFKMTAAGTESKINKLYPIYGEGEEEADNILAGIYYGGWKYGDHSYTGVTNADAWPDSKIYSRAGGAEKIYIDGYEQQTQANNDARSENKVQFEIGKPFSLPVRGAYMKFDAERTGVMTAYFVQNGDLDYNGEVLKSGSDIARRSYFITDEFGNIVTPISAMSKEKLPAQSDVVNTSCGGNTSATNYVKALADKELTPEGNLINWTWNTSERQPVLYDEATKGYHVLQKAYVKYVFNVEAGKSYYVFSSASKIGFAGANFQVDDAAELSTKSIAHEASLVLDQTADYTAPSKKTWYDEVTLNRSFTAGEWSTIVLPFSLSEAKVKEIFGDDVQLTVFNGVQGSTVNFFYHVNQNIIAGYPYIILPSQNVESITVKNVTIDPAVQQYVFDNSSEGGHPSWKGNGDYFFKGLDGYSKASDKEAMCKYSYYMAADGLHRTTSGTLTCNGYRAYLKYTGSPSVGPAKIATVTVSGIEEELDENTATAIMAAIDADDMFVPAAVKGVYNLNGQKIADSAEGLSNGIYVINGKKVIINK